MNILIDQLAKSVLQKNSLQECSEDELQKLVDQYPYFSAARLLLLQKLKITDPTRFNEQLQITSLFFHNPLWLAYLLNEEGSMGSIPSEKNEMKKENSSTKESELIFEPYHTVDYFASQGIKVAEEIKPQDKFGQQLKSFTEWLKTLKRLPLTEITKEIDITAENKVEQLAGHSLEEREVVTETMADVWEKQGNYNKALEVYTKLSLLDPSKNSYFAAKIEQLKKQI